MAEPRTRAALAVERDQLAADTMAMLLCRPMPEDVAALQRFREHLIARYEALAAEIDAQGEAAEQAKLSGVGLMSMQRVEEAWILWKRLGFRQMVAPHPNGPKSDYLRRLWRLSDRARARYYRRKGLIGGDW